jgi:hypothetical protein
VSISFATTVLSTKLLEEKVVSMGPHENALQPNEVPVLVGYADDKDEEDEEDEEDDEDEGLDDDDFDEQFDEDWDEDEEEDEEEEGEEDE